MSNLTEEQLRKIEENRQKALKIKQQKSSFSQSASSSIKGNVYLKKDSFVSQEKQASENLRCTVVDNDRFMVSCKYSPQFVSIFKTISSRKYDPTTKSWSFTLSDFDKLESKIKSCGERLPVPDNAVIVNTPDGAKSAVQLNNCANDLKTGKCYLISRTRFEIDIPFDSDTVGLFKTIPSKSYNVTTRKWTFHLSDYNRLYDALKRLVHIQIVPLPSTVLTVFKNQIAAKANESDVCVSDSDLANLDGSLVMSLMPFQKEGVKFAISRKGRILLADDMGLGKTVQSICIAAYFSESWPLLVVCPSSVRLMWKEALLKWLPTRLSEDDVNVLCTSRDEVSHSSVFVISYDLLSKLQKEFVDKKFKVAILDESHFIKNFKTARTRAVGDVVKHCKHLILLSGTPALSRPSELYTQLALLRHDLFPRFHQFALRYCAAKQTPWGWEYSGSSNMEELRIILEETVMLRRTKEDVLSQLPPKVRCSIAIDVGNSRKNSKLKESFEKAHHAIEKKGLSVASRFDSHPSYVVASLDKIFHDDYLYLEESDKQQIKEGVEKHGALLQFFSETAKMKLPAIKSYVIDLLEGGRKLLVFAHHKIVLDSLQNELDKKNYDYMRIDGNTASDKRQMEVARFQEKSSCKVALLSITAANMGINLHAASLVVFAELFWNPGILVQAEDRCYRIGQRDLVNVHYLVAKGTSDDYVWEMIKKKLNVLSQAGLNKSNFDDTESHEVKKATQNSIMQYFQTKTDAKSAQANDSPSNCDLAISEDELLQLFDADFTNFDSPDDDSNNASECLHPEPSNSGPSNSSSCHDEGFRKRRDDMSPTKEYNDDLSAVTKWKRKKKLH